MSFRTILFTIGATLQLLQASGGVWLDKVAPVITPAEKKAYLGLKVEERRAFEESFWATRSIAPNEYFARLEYVDSQFGSTRAGSGANTDQGRVYLALGPPVRVKRLASSRVFVPLEIWYYDAVPGVLNTELRLIFFTANNTGWPRLYSPTLDTVRALLLPQASAKGMFGPNASTSESDIRQILKVGPAEDEVISASVNVASGIRATGNDEILRQVTSPAEMFAIARRTEVKSRLIVARPKLDTIASNSPYGGRQVDLRLETAAQREIEVQVLAGQRTVYQHRLNLKSAGGPLVYRHRLDLLPGNYRVVFSVDGLAFPYALDVAEQGYLGEIVRGHAVAAPGRKPWIFDGKQFDLIPEGKFAAVPVGHAGPVTWTIRKGTQLLWRSVVESGQFASVELPSNLAPGSYRLEASSGDETVASSFTAGTEAHASGPSAVVSFNANLAPAIRFAFVGHQWLLRGNLEAARQSLQASLAQGGTIEARIELARVGAMAGDLDGARSEVNQVLAVQPKNFEALSVLAYIEAQFQDYAVAADLYRRALAVQDSAAIRTALAKLPTQ